MSVSRETGVDTSRRQCDPKRHGAEMVVSVVRVLSADVERYIERGDVACDDGRAVGSLYQFDEFLEAGIKPSKRCLE
jgi:hypothetical protein